MLDLSKLSAEEAAEYIAVDQYEIHKAYAKKFITFGEEIPDIFSTGIVGPRISDLVAGGLRRTPSLPAKPRQKFTICGLAGKYAAELIRIEIRYRPHLMGSYEAAIARTGKLVSDRVKANAGTYHATEEEIAAAARKAMLEVVSTSKPQSLPAPAPEILDLGQTIKALRKEAGWTAQELAKAVHLTPRTIFRHEANQAAIRRAHLQSYEKALSDILKRHISLQRHTKVTTTSH